MLFDGIQKKKQTDLFEIWPADEKGSKIQPAFLIHLANNDMQDELVVNMLESYGIPCIMKYPGNGGFGKVILGMSGEGTDIYVPETMLEDANNIMNGDFSEDELS